MSSSQSPGPQASGRYELREVIARGGMGTIRRAYDRLGAREIAYKNLRVANAASRPLYTALFQREFDTLARLEHPNIVQVFDYGFDDDGPFYTMELLSGEDLAKLAPLSIQEACRILRDVASALALLHARQLLHRDVSPSNVRLTGDRRAKLIDFGALCPFGRTRETAGTPAFVAPECLHAEPLDQRADLYSLGALAYWTLTRRLAVRAYSLDGLADALLAPVTPPSAHVPELPAELNELIMSLLAQDRSARPARAVDVIERLTQIAELPPENDEQVAYSYLKHPPLQGRDTLVRSVQHGLDGVRSGRGEILWIEGMPGSGRTAALSRLGIEAQLHGATVLRAEGRVHTGPLGVAAHLMQTGLSTFPDLAVALREQSSIFADSGTSVQTAIEAAERRARQSTAIQTVLVQLSLRCPLVLAIDDASMIDGESLSLLASMVESIQCHPMMLALATLDGAVKSDAEAKLRASATRVTLDSLSELDVEGLVLTMFGGAPNTHALAVYLHAETGGNPGHCLDLARLLLQRGEIRYVGGAFVLPPDIEQLAVSLRGSSPQVSRLAGLAAKELRVLRALSRCEEALSIEQLSEVLALPSSEVVTALGRLADLGVIVAAWGQYAFASQALRRAVAESMGTDEARALHLALAQLFLRREPRSIGATFTAGLQLMQAGGEHELEGAELIRRVAHEHPIDTWASMSNVTCLEMALGVLTRAGRPEAECVDLLAPLSGLGFYGNLGAQTRHLDRAMESLSRLAGLSLATRMSRWVGPRLALALGILIASVRRALRREQRSVVQNITSIARIVPAAIGAATSALDRWEAERILGWLAPFAGAPENSALQINREFCRGTVMLSALRYAKALELYEWVLANTQSAAPGIDDRTRQHLRLGTLNGIAQICVERRPDLAGAAADDMASSVFFAPHAEATRMGIHLLRGSLDQAELHRVRAETLALGGGISWSVMVMLATRIIHGSLLSDNVVGLVRGIADLERLQQLSPGLAAMRELAEATLSLLRGRAREAEKRLSALLETEHGRTFQMHYVACVLHARALNAIDQPTRAKELCEQALAQLGEADGALMAAQLGLVEQLALAEAGLGRFERASELLEATLQEVLPSSNPLQLGSLHRTRAQVALRQRDVEAFELHFVAMETWFRATENPWLIQQCEALLTGAGRAGLRCGLMSQRSSAPNEALFELDGSTEVSADPEEVLLPTTEDERRPARGRG